MSHILTVDFEDWHRLVGQSLGLRVRTRGSAVEASVDVLLQLLDDTFTKATFFILGELAEKLPHIVRRISLCGHEIASHGYRHYPAPAKSPDFAEDTRRSVAVLSQITGKSVRGYRGPRFGLPQNLAAFFDTLADAGLAYDATVFPFAGRNYGVPWFPQTPVKLSTSSGVCMAELPAAVLKSGDEIIPVAGGSSWYTTPPGHILAWVRRFEDDGRPFVAYLHSYDFDPAALRLSVEPTDPAQGREIQRIESTFNTGRERIVGLMRALLGTFRFTPAAQWLAEHPDLPTTTLTAMGSTRFLRTGEVTSTSSPGGV